MYLTLVGNHLEFLLAVQGVTGWPVVLTFLHSVVLSASPKRAVVLHVLTGLRIYLHSVL